MEESSEKRDLQNDLIHRDENNSADRCQLLPFPQNSAVEAGKVWSELQRNID
jgi:hypothetical protein